MIDMRGFWNRHKRTIFLAVGAAGTGYALYWLYDAHRKRALDLEKQLEGYDEAEELIKSQLQSHFDNIQRIADTTTLPYAMHYLRSRVSEELDLSPLTEKLMLGKGQPGVLTPKEKLELWERLKVLSFARTASSMWAMTMLCLYVRVQVNILGRHLYVETARGPEGSEIADAAGTFNRPGQQEFLATADFLPTWGISSLIFNMQNVALEVMKEKQLKDHFAMLDLHKTFIHLLESFMALGVPNYWLNYLIPESAVALRQLMAMSSSASDDSPVLMDITKLEQLMTETRMVLSSRDFSDVVETSLRKVTEMVVEEIGAKVGETGRSSGLPLAKLLALVAQVGNPLLEEASSNKFVQAIHNQSQVQLFFTLLYANIPPEI